MKPVKTNYHAHTTYCGHSVNHAETLIEQAISNGYTKFGISEHMPLPHNYSRKPTLKQLDKLIAEVNILKQKYQDQIEILFGLECEYAQGELEKLVKSYFQRNDIDYLIFGNHFAQSCHEKLFFWNTVHDKDMLVMKYYDFTEYALASGLFSAYNHPDIFVREFATWDERIDILSKKIVACAIQYDVPLEFNLNGLATKYDLNKIMEHYNIKSLDDWKKLDGIKITDTCQEQFLTKQTREFMYPTYHFFKHAKDTKVKINIGVDTHNPELMNDHYYQLALHLIDEWGLKPNLIDDLKMKHQL